MPELRASLETINKTACGLITDIDRNFSEIIKERGIDLNQGQAIEPELSTQTIPVDAMQPDAPEQALDEYPMPDSELTIVDLDACGYLDGDLLPLSKDLALELFEQDLNVYMIENGGADMSNAEYATR